MLGSKEIRDFTPEKAVFGGYDARSVDMMLDQAADDMEALERENAELRAKLKVMVDKIEEYRRIESGIRQALMTAPLWRYFAENPASPEEPREE